MDKILQSTSKGGHVSVTNDGATILKSVLIDVRRRPLPRARPPVVAPRPPADTLSKPGVLLR
jgi:hypothetical protein